jgi:hypothetical protein
MSLLVSKADRHTTVSYDDVAQYLGKKANRRFAKSKRHIGHVADAVMQRIFKVAPQAPPINTLIVERSGPQRGLPGAGADGYLKDYLDVDYSSLSVSQKRVSLRAVHEAVWHYEKWRSIGRKAFGEEFVAPPDLVGEDDGKSRRLGFGGPPESYEHRRLKEYVAAHPKQFSAPKGCKKGETEKRLDTLDEIDVWFMYPGRELAIEVKSTRSNEMDRQRGLFQCVKYRALLTARSHISRSKSVIRTMLVSEVPLSPKLTRWARLLDVEVMIIKPLV